MLGFIIQKVGHLFVAKLLNNNSRLFIINDCSENWQYFIVYLIFFFPVGMFFSSKCSANFKSKIFSKLVMSYILTIRDKYNLYLTYNKHQKQENSSSYFQFLCKIRRGEGWLLNKQSTGCRQRLFWHETASYLLSNPCIIYMNKDISSCLSNGDWVRNSENNFLKIIYTCNADFWTVCTKL